MPLGAESAISRIKLFCRGGVGFNRIRECDTAPPTATVFEP